ncbi:MAG: AAA family ATPase [Jhaorihella sp.]
MAEEQNEMMVLVPEDMEKLLDYVFDERQNLFIWGAPGVGKTQMTRQLAERKNAQYLPLHLTLMEPVDLRGLPVVNEDRTGVKWVPMGELPTDPDSVGVVHLDELNTAGPSVMAAAMQFALDKRIGEYQLPEGWRIIACGNRVSDGAAARKMPTALADRFSHVEATTSVDSWSKWALEAGLPGEMIGFLNFRKDLLHNFSASRTVNTTPRGWEDVGRAVAEDPKLDSMATLAYVSGRVGKGPIAELRSFVRVWRDLPDIEKILAGEITELKDGTDVAVKYAATVACAMSVKKGQFGTMLDFLDKIGPEFSRMAIMMALKRDARLRHDASYQDWVANRMSKVSG